MFRGIAIALFGVAVTTATLGIWYYLQPAQDSKWFLFAAGAAAATVSAGCKDGYTAAITGCLLALAGGLAWYYTRGHQYSMFIAMAAIGQASWGLANLERAIRAGTTGQAPPPPVTG